MLEIYTCGGDETKLKKLRLNTVQSVIINTGADSRFCYIFDAGKELREFMQLHLQGANMIPRAERQRCIHLSMRCENKLYPANPGYYQPFVIDLRIWTVNAKATRRADLDSVKQHAGCPLPLKIINQTVSYSRES